MIDRSALLGTSRWSIDTHKVQHRDTPHTHTRHVEHALTHSKSHTQTCMVSTMRRRMCGHAPQSPLAHPSRDVCWQYTASCTQSALCTYTTLGTHACILGMHAPCTYARMHTFPYARTLSYARTHAYLYACEMNICTHAYVTLNMHTCVRAVGFTQHVLTCACIHTTLPCAHTYVHTYTTFCTPASTTLRLHTLHIYVRYLACNIHTYIHTYATLCAHAYVRTLPCACMQSYSCRCTYPLRSSPNPRTCTPTHKYLHQTRTHTLSGSGSPVVGERAPLDANHCRMACGVVCVCVCACVCMEM